MRLQKNTVQIPRKVFPEAQDIPRHGSGDLLKDRFGHMMEFEEFHDWRTVDKAQWTSEKQIRCADAQWTLTMTRRALLLPYRSSSSKSNNAHSGIAGNVWIKTIYGTGVLQSQRAPDPDFRIS